MELTSEPHVSAAAQARKLTRSAPPKTRAGVSGFSAGNVFDLETAGQRLGLTQEQVASALNLSAQTSRHWDSEAGICRTNKSIRELRELLSRMDEHVVASKEKDWLSSPLEACGGRSPRALIVEGRIRDLITGFDRLREGQPVCIAAGRPGQSGDVVMLNFILETHYLPNSPGSLTS